MPHRFGHERDDVKEIFAEYKEQISELTLDKAKCLAKAEQAIAASPDKFTKLKATLPREFQGDFY